VIILLITFLEPRFLQEEIVLGMTLCPIIDNCEFCNLRPEGVYEYAYKMEGEFQDDPVFNNVAARAKYVIINDKNGCGITEPIQNVG